MAATKRRRRSAARDVYQRDHRQDPRGARRRDRSLAATVAGLRHAAQPLERACLPGRQPAAHAADPAGTRLRLSVLADLSRRRACWRKCPAGRARHAGRALEEAAVKDEETDEKKLVWWIRPYTVFNLDQVDGVEAPPIEHEPIDFEPIDRCEGVLSRMPDPPRVRHQPGGRLLHAGERHDHPAAGGELPRRGGLLRHSVPRDRPQHRTCDAS